MTRSIRPVEPTDLGEIFTLQRAAFVDEARLYETAFVPALDETVDEFTERMQASNSWAAMQGNRIVGAVSLRTGRCGVANVERLMVAPDCRGQGISSVLLQVVEDAARLAGRQSLQLTVGELATNNRAIYRHLGWVEESSEYLVGFEHVLLHVMVKTF